MRAYAAGHDAAVLCCLDALLHADTASGLPALAAARAQLALRFGGLGLRSAERHAVAAYWASWADALPALARRDRAFAQTDGCRFALRPSPRRTTPPTLHAGGSARLHAPLMSFATVPSAVSLMPQASLCWTRSRALMPRVSSPPDRSRLSP